MYFMRSSALPGPGPFTLEAKVEDLLAGTTGVIQTPLKTSRNAPGLVATDALVVRPFKGAADKFEADQVLSYEGEALSPVLNPVFRAEQPIDLQIYLRLYPDIHGAPDRYEYGSPERRTGSRAHGPAIQERPGRIARARALPARSPAVPITCTVAKPRSFLTS